MFITKPTRATPGGWTRRSLLNLAAWLGVTLGIAPSFAAPSNPAKRRPQIGDRLVFAFGPRQHRPVGTSELVVDSPPIAAVPMEPSTGLIRDGSRLNQVMVMKLDPARLSAKTEPYAVQGIVAYSAVCTHTGCPVENWNARQTHLVCTCHQSEFDVTDAARVVFGPAPKPLAMLPIRIEDQVLVVAGGFSRRVGAQLE